jgi:hypothetical protein
MNLEDQVVSLKLAKRLNKLKVEIYFSLFKWEEYCGIARLYSFDRPSEISGSMPYSAFTCSELLSILPNRITISDKERFNSFRLNIIKSIFISDPLEMEIEDLYIINYECDSTECTGENAWLRRQLMRDISDIKFSDCLAKMLIYLIENGLMKGE